MAIDPYDVPGVPQHAHILPRFGPVSGLGFAVLAQASLAADFPLNADVAYHTIVSLALTPGTWDVTGQIYATVGDAGSLSEDVFARLFDGTTAYAVAATNNGALAVTLDLQAVLSGRVIVASGTTTLTLQARTTLSTGGDIVRSTRDAQAAGAATHLRATRIA